MRLTTIPIVATLGLPLAAPLAAQGTPLDAFRDNVAAIHARDRAAYLSHYLQTAALARVGPDGLQQGYEEFARGAGAGWPDTLVATHFRIVPLTADVAYGVYRYRVVDSSGSVRGVSERVLVRTPAGWKVAVTTAFPTPDAVPPPIAIVGATLVDGTGAAAVRNAVVVMREGRIACAGPRATCPVPADADTVSALGKWIIPGLIDTHVHFSQTAGWTVDRTPWTCGIATPTRRSRRSCTPDPNGSSAPTYAAASRRCSTWAATRGRWTCRRGRRGVRRRRASWPPGRCSRPSISGSTCPTSANSSIWRTSRSSAGRYARTRRGGPRPSSCGTSCRRSRPTRHASPPWCARPVTRLARWGCRSSCTRQGCGKPRTRFVPGRACWCTLSGRHPWTTSSWPSRGARERSTSRRSRSPTGTARWRRVASRVSDSRSPVSIPRPAPRRSRPTPWLWRSAPAPPRSRSAPPEPRGRSPRRRRISNGSTTPAFPSPSAPMPATR